MGLMKDFDIRIRNGGDDAIAAVAELLPRWISVHERLPDMNELVLCVDACPGDEGDDEPDFVVAYRHADGWSTSRFERCGQWPFTHWMPLPARPTDAK